jgi:hypothetical protein
VFLVRGAIFVGLFIYFYFVPCQMQQKVRNELNKKVDDPVRRKIEPSKENENQDITVKFSNLHPVEVQLSPSSGSIVTQF